MAPEARSLRTPTKNPILTPHRRMLVSLVLTILWTKLFLLWKFRNKAIHGHNLSSQQQACKCQLRLEMEYVHMQRDQVLASNTYVFMGNTQADLDHPQHITATQIQNWLHLFFPASDPHSTYPFTAFTPCRHTSLPSPRLQSNLSPIGPTKQLAPN
jgi:hypothetical protein